MSDERCASGAGKVKSKTPLFKLRCWQTLVSEKAPQMVIDEEEFFAFFHRHDESLFFKRAQIFRGSEAFAEAAFFYKADLAIRLFEN